MVKINLAVVCDSIDYTLGGSSISAKRFITALKNKGYTITLITNSIKDPNSNFFKGLDVFEIENHFLFKSKNYIFGKVSHKKLIKIFRNKNIDLVYSVYPTTFSGNAAAKASKYLKLPLVGHFHVQAENVSILFSKCNVDALFYKFFKSFYNKCDLIFAPSRFAKDLLNKSGVKTKKVILSNGVDLGFFNNKNISQNTTFIKDEANFTFLYLGRLEKEKDLFTLVKAAEIILGKFKNVKFLIGGNGSIKQELADYIYQKNLQDNVKLLGFINNSDIVSLYNCADCFVSPSLIELEGMTVLEAMACGLPIILSNSKRSASKDFVKENGFLFRAKNVKDLSKKLEIVLKLSANQLHKMRENSLLLAKNYSFEVSVQKMDDLFKKYINRK